MSLLQLEGRVQEDDYAELKAKLSRLERELRDSREENLRVRQEAKREVAQVEAAGKELRRILSPLHHALSVIFGELENLPVSGQASAAAGTDPRWESWKQRLPGRPAEFIDLLLVHGSMTIKQFMAASHCGQNSAYQTVSKLGQAGVTVNVGGRYSLKP
jgi:hypothetical protein